MTTRTGRRSLVTYALVADTLMTWLVTGSDTVFQRATIDGRAFANTMSLVRSAMEVGTRESAVVPHLERLYDLLIRPIEPRLAANGSLIVAADGPIANVPFAALRDSKRRQYLVERLTIQFASGGRTSEVLHGPSVRRPVFVADPQVVGSNFANLAPLAAAATEGAAAAALYPNATLLRGTDADSSSVVGALQQADLFHFAGHAVLDDVEPERSYLVIGSRGLNAGAIANLRLPQLKLVVLSACETIRSTQSATGGFFGLAEAFFAAGARGVIGSLWRVDDAETRTLMQDFHRSYARTGDAARALQTAQIAAIRAGARSPSAWSGFRYAGF